MIELTLTGPEFAELSRQLKGADKKIQAEMRKAIRKAGEDAVRDVRREIMAIPSSGQYGTGVRAALAAGTRTSISARGKSAGVTITTSPGRLPSNKRVLAKAMNKASFRHRVFGSDTWVAQSGNPYFGKVIGGHYMQMRGGIVEAMVRAERQLAAEMSQG